MEQLDLERPFSSPERATRPESNLTIAVEVQLSQWKRNGLPGWSVRPSSHCACPLRERFGETPWVGRPHIGRGGVERVCGHGQFGGGVGLIFGRR
jgi:hypothetical protein